MNLDDEIADKLTCYSDEEKAARRKAKMLALAIEKKVKKTRKKNNPYSKQLQQRFLAKKGTK